MFHRTAIEHEKKSFAESFEHGKVMEGKLVTMAREMEKLRAELANAEKRTPAGAPVGISGILHLCPVEIYSAANEFEEEFFSICLLMCNLNLV